MSTTAPKLPPGPRGLPFVGHLHQFRRDPLGFLTTLARDYGDVAQFRLGRRRVVQINRPDLIREVLVVQHRKFVKTGVLKRARPVLGEGLVTVDGEIHLRRRKLIQPAFSRGRIADYLGSIVSPTETASKCWTHGERLDVAEEMNRLTLKIILGALFNRDTEDEGAKIEQALTVVLQHFGRLLADPMWTLLSKLPLAAARRYRVAQRQLDQFVSDLIERRRFAPRRESDVLSVLLQSRDDPAFADCHIDDRQLRDEVMTLFTAGHETIATALSWTWYALAQNPDVERRLHQEVDALFTRGVVRLNHLEELDYTRRVMMESMRMYPPVWGMTRMATQDLELGGFHIPARTVIGMTQFVTHNDPQYFAQPAVFDPERWRPERMASIPRFAYFPFGGGPRLCIGEPFAWAEGILVLATLARDWALTLAPDQQVGFEPLLTLRPSHGILMTPHRRSTATSTTRSASALRPSFVEL